MGGVTAGVTGGAGFAVDDDDVVGGFIFYMSDVVVADDGYADGVGVDGGGGVAGDVVVVSGFGGVYVNTDAVGVRGVVGVGVECGYSVGGGGCGVV